MLFVPGGGAATALGAMAGGLLRFATSTIGMVLIAAVLAYGGGWREARKKCEAESARARLAIAQADLTAASVAATMTEAQTGQLEAEERANKEKVDALLSDLRKRPGRACGLSESDARRLRGLR